MNAPRGARTGRAALPSAAAVRAAGGRPDPAPVAADAVRPWPVGRAALAVVAASLLLWTLILSAGAWLVGAGPFG